MNKTIDFKDVTDIMVSLNSYKNLASMLPQLSKDKSLQDFCTSDGKQPIWYKSQILKDWERIDIHVVCQSWGNTSCGWGGIGGSAISSKYNIIIENRFHKAYYVFWDGRLAYILENNKSIDLSRLPSHTGEKIDYLIYKHQKSKSN